jgi:hypothetical protein
MISAGDALAAGRNKVAAGMNPAAIAAPGGNPDGSLSSTVRLTPQGLLSFRYVDGIV